MAIEIHGDKGFVGATRLDNNANNFERGRKDDFEVCQGRGLRRAKATIINKNTIINKVFWGWGCRGFGVSGNCRLAVWVRLR